MKAFIEYMLDNETEIAEAAQFVPLTDEQLEKAKSDLEDAAGGRSWLATRRDRGRGASAARQRRRYGEDVVKGLLALCALVSVATTVGIVVALLLPALEFFREVASSTS